MQFPNKIKFDIRTKFKHSSLIDEQVFRAKFVLPIVCTTVAVTERLVGLQHFLN